MKKKIKDPQEVFNDIKKRVSAENEKVEKLKEETIQLLEEISGTKEDLADATKKNDLTAFKDAKIRLEFLEARQAELERILTSSKVDPLIDEPTAREYERILIKAKNDATQQQIDVLTTVYNSLAKCLETTSSQKLSAHSIHNVLYNELWRKGRYNSRGEWVEDKVPDYNTSLDLAMRDIMESINDMIVTKAEFAGLGKYKMQRVNLSPEKVVK